MLDLNPIKFILETPKSKLFECAAICMLPYITWKYFYNIYKEEIENYKEAVLFQKRHNCVVIYFKGKGHSGWPTETPYENLNIKNIEKLYEPFLYFINTAKKSLNIAIMGISVKFIIDALIEAHKRGVTIKIISNFYMSTTSLNYYKEMKKEGIQISLFVSKDKTNSIMHTKYIVKDYDFSNGYLLTGSFNISNSAFISNYEDVVFTSKKNFVEDFHNNFNTMWATIKEDNKNIFNQLILENSGFIK